MQKVNVHEAKMKLPALLAEIEQHGESFLICRNGKPSAELAPYTKGSRLASHPILSGIAINYDPMEDLSNDEWGMLNAAREYLCTSSSPPPC